jgi:hypothetical protein
LTQLTLQCHVLNHQLRTRGKNRRHSRAVDIAAAAARNTTTDKGLQHYLCCRAKARSRRNTPRMRQGHPLQFVTCCGVATDRHQRVQRMMRGTLVHLPFRHQLFDECRVAGDARNDLQKQ